MKKMIIAGLLGVVLALGFSGCDAELDPSDEGDSAFSKPRGELTISNINSGVIITSVKVYKETGRPADLDALNRYQSPIAIAYGISNSKPTVTLSTYTGNSVWDGTGSYGVFLAISYVLNNPNIPSTEPPPIVGYWAALTFDKGRAAASFSGFVSIRAPEPVSPSLSLPEGAPSS
ncbi:hypothetical protein LQZ21_05425 [Treponema sp. TIM-1]|uniref:hypothetical protein n=1 Tax=Treponema sp. TIM-1 TaxID=2898417 RepID=UPI00397E9711